MEASRNDGLLPTRIVSVASGMPGLRVVSTTSHPAELPGRADGEIDLAWLVTDCTAARQAVPADDPMTPVLVDVTATAWWGQHTTRLDVGMLSSVASAVESACA